MVYRVAKVIDNNDLDKEDKIKVRIYPEFIDIKDSELPWIYPYSNGKDGQKDVGKRQIPENDSYIRVVILDNFWQEIFYVEGQFLTDNKLYNLFDTSLKSKVSEIGVQTYPQPNIIETFKDGSCEFRNTDTGEYCLLHNSGSYFFIDKDGKVYINSGSNEIKLYNSVNYIKIVSNQIELNGNTENAILGTTLYNLLISLCTTIATATSGNMAQNAAGIETIKTAFSTFNGLLSTIKSNKVKLS